MHELSNNQYSYGEMRTKERSTRGTGSEINALLSGQIAEINHCCTYLKPSRVYVPGSSTETSDISFQVIKIKKNQTKPKAEKEAKRI